MRSAPNEISQFANCGIVKEIADIYFAWMTLIYGQHDFRECKRTDANFKQIVVGADLPFFRKFAANQLDLPHKRVVIKIIPGI